MGRLVGLAAAGIAHRCGGRNCEQSTLLTGRCSNQSLHRGLLRCKSTLRGQKRPQTTRPKAVDDIALHNTKSGNELQRLLVCHALPHLSAAKGLIVEASWSCGSRVDPEHECVVAFVLGIQLAVVLCTESGGVEVSLLFNWGRSDVSQIAACRKSTDDSSVVRE